MGFNDNRIFTHLIANRAFRSMVVVSGMTYLPTCVLVGILQRLSTVTPREVVGRGSGGGGGVARRI